MKQLFAPSARVLAIAAASASSLVLSTTSPPSTRASSSTSSPYPHFTGRVVYAEAVGLEEQNSAAPGGSAKIYPVYRQMDVSEHVTREKGIWVTYREGVYDITKFIQNHPGGADKIVLAAGKSVEPFWRIYRQHYNSKLAMEMLAPMRVGTLHPDDLAAQTKEKDSSDPYSQDPEISPVMIVHSEKPVNAEPPANILGHSFLTPNDAFFVRNHHPVPQIDASKHQLEIDLGVTNKQAGSEVVLGMNELKTQFPKRCLIASIQCGGNRREEMNQYGRTAGTPWQVGAISTAKWAGTNLRELLHRVGCDEDFADAHNIKHVQFCSVDGMMASVPIDTILGRRSEAMLAYEMNDEELPAAHGYPLRVVVPGHVGVRNVKWVNKIVLSDEEAQGPWQRGMAYKGFGPSTKSLEGIETEKIQSVQHMGVQSSVLGPEKFVVGEKNTVKGFAYSGGGRGIVRVDVSVDGGQTWQSATLTEGGDQEMTKAWAWTLWETEVEVPHDAASDGETSMTVICKATDASYNVQPDSVQGIWNLRGINNNAWHRRTIPVIEEDEEEEEGEEEEERQV